MNNSYDPLLNCFKRVPQNALSLWVLDENTPPDIQLFYTDNPTVFITNRFDVYSSLKNTPAINTPSNKVDYYFNDFDFSVLKNQCYNHIFYRISKEKPVTHHIINQCLRHLSAEGKLYLCGKKNEGIKSLAKNITQRLSLDVHTEKVKENYIITVQATHKNVALIEKIRQKEAKLDDKNYINYIKVKDIEIGNLPSLEINSKPGVYGWKKIDEGTSLLMSTFYQHIHECQITLQEKNVLDLGCGSGIISLFSKSLQFKHVTATDNNAAAIDTTKFNATKNTAEIHVIASDCAKTINEKFDYILCNPPFHKGFDTNCTLTQQFVASAANHAKPGAEAWFVVNVFIGIERIAKHYFKQLITVEKNQHFKVIRCIY